MAQKYNYVPFALREVVTVAANGGWNFISLGALAAAHNAKTIIGDMNILVTGPAIRPPVTQFLLIRIGYSGRGYLLEDRIPYNLFTNRGKPLCSCWQFPMPYTIFPGQQMWANMDPGEAQTARYQGIMFNGVRQLDQIPHLIYGVSTAMSVNGTRLPILSPTMKCPGDSPVDLYSVTIHEHMCRYADFANATAVQVRGPDGRDWFKVQDRTGGVAGNLILDQWWLNIPVSYLELGGERGWWLNPGEAFTMDLENIDPASNLTVAVTIRGSIEVAL